MGGRSGKVYLLGPGTSDMLGDSDETEMFDHDDEDKDLESQVGRGQSHSTNDKAGSRSEREETPAPAHSEKQQTPEPVEGENPFDTPSSTSTEKSATFESPTRAEMESATALPTKLVNPSKED